MELKQNGGHKIARASMDGSPRCGMGSCHPSALSACASMFSFVAFFSFACLITQSLTSYVTSQLTTLERQFGLSSSESGFLITANEIGFLCAVLFLSYLGRRGHIPRILGYSTIIFGVAGLLCCLPYFFIRQLEVTQIATNVSGPSIDAAPDLCGASQDSNSTGCQSEDYENLSDGTKAGYALLVVGMLIQGMAKSPRFSLATTYVDDNTNKVNTGMYVGVIYCGTILGPVVAFSLGGIFSGMHVTLKDTGLSPMDPRWIGAWWLGFIIFGGAALVIGIPLLFFPKSLVTRHAKTKALKKHSFWIKFKGIWKAVKRLATNPVYVGMVLAESFSLFSIASSISFLPKYLETQYLLPTWLANIIIAFLYIFGACIGALTGGFLTTKLRITCITNLKIALVTAAIPCMLMNLVFMLGCDQPIIEDHDSYGILNGNTSASCFRSCGCDAVPLFPLCGSDGKNYYSACHAGCSTANTTTQIFADCECIGSGNGTAVPGFCQTDCTNMYPFAALMFVTTVFGSIGMIPCLIVTLRSVSEDDKAIAIGVSAFMADLLGWMPGPVVYGKLVDSTCLIWSYTCSERGACSLYNITKFRLRFFAVSICVLLVSFCFLVFAFIKAINRKDFYYADPKDMKDTEIPIPERKQLLDESSASTNSAKHFNNGM